MISHRSDQQIEEEENVLPEQYASILEKEKIDALAEFAAGVGHEFNNPLAIISGHTQLLLSEIEQSSQRHHLAVILAQVKRAYEMIADIRLFARPPQPQLSSIHLDSWLQNFVAQQRNLFSQCQERLCLSPFECDGERDPVMTTDPAILSTILGAVVKNAVEAVTARSTGMVVIAGMQTSDQGFRFVIQDNGPGIPEEIQRHIFSPFFSGRSSGRGLGFGLPKAFRFTQILGGTLSLASTGGGCTVTISFPCNVTSSEEEF